MSFVRASWIVVGRVTLFNASRLGTVNCGAVTGFPNGMILFRPSTADCTTELKVVTSFWMLVRMVLRLLWMTLVI